MFWPTDIVDAETVEGSAVNLSWVAAVDIYQARILTRGDAKMRSQLTAGIDR